MKDWIGKKARIIINVEGSRHTYTAKIIDVTDSHITFIDKFETKYTKILSEVLDIEEVKEWTV